MLNNPFQVENMMINFCALVLKAFLRKKKPTYCVGFSD